MTRAIKLLPLLIVAALVAGCDPQDLTPAQTKAICHAMIGPIRYNSLNPQSKRYAAIYLAMDLKQRNQVYTGLRCVSHR
jgi:hypothetical protein